MPPPPLSAVLSTLNRWVHFFQHRLEEGPSCSHFADEWPEAQQGEQPGMWAVGPSLLMVWIRSTQAAWRRWPRAAAVTSSPAGSSGAQGRAEKAEDPGEGARVTIPSPQGRLGAFGGCTGKGHKALSSETRQSQPLPAPWCLRVRTVLQTVFRSPS